MALQVNCFGLIDNSHRRTDDFFFLSVIALASVTLVKSLRNLMYEQDARTSKKLNN